MDADRRWQNNGRHGGPGSIMENIGQSMFRSFSEANAHGNSHRSTVTDQSPMPMQPDEIPEEQEERASRMLKKKRACWIVAYLGAGLLIGMAIMTIMPRGGNTDHIDKHPPAQAGPSVTGNDPLDQFKPTVPILDSPICSKFLAYGQSEHFRRLKEELQYLIHDGDLGDFDVICSPQYLALSWMAFEDEHFVSSPASVSNLRFAGVDKTSTALVPLIQRYVIALLYFMWDGSNWTTTTNWLSPTLSECHWSGVVCDKDTGRSVVELNFHAVGLAGTIPKEIAKLNVLRILDLSDNLLRGPLPQAFYNLANLEGLILYKNKLDGDISQSVVKLSQLRILEARFNDFTGHVLDGISSCTHLQVIDIDHNDFIGSIPKKIGKLTDLRVFDIFQNKFTGTLPTELGHLTKLDALDIYQNFFTGKIPSEIGTMSALTTFMGGNNDFTGSIPSEFGQLQYLKYIDLGRCDLEGALPSELSQMQSLAHLDLHTNLLIGTIPESLGVSLTYLDISANSISGQIPEHLGLLTKLELLHLGWNQLTGTIPSHLGTLTDLEVLILYTNKLVGFIPYEFGSLRSLVQFQLQMNKLSGAMPSAVCKLRAVQLVDLTVDCEVVCSCCSRCG